MECNKLSERRKVFWPDNPVYISFGVSSTAASFLIFIKYLNWTLCPFPVFLMAVFVSFFYTQRIVVDKEFVSGPIAYGKRKKITKIPRYEAEAFFEPGKMGFGNLAIRHKHSSEQILVPCLYFSSSSLEELKHILQN